MTNLRRLRLTDRIFFVTTNLRRGYPLLEEAEFELLGKVFVEVHAELAFALCGYVFMPDHWHALLWPRSPLTISKVMEQLKDRSSLLINQHRGTSGSLWQPRFWDRFARNRREFNQRLEYMHFNPVRRKLVASPEEWRWSSYNNFSLDPSVVASCPIPIDYIRLSDDYRG